MRKRISLFSIALVVISMQFAILVSAFEKKEDPEIDRIQMFAMSIPDYPLISDFSSNDYAAQDVLNLFMAGLVRVGGNFDEIVPEIASSWDISEDGKTYTFYLRSAKWNDGTYVTASDFSTSWLKNIKERQDTDLFIISGAEQYAKGAVDKEEVGIKALNDSTLQVKFIEADSYNIKYLTEASFYPQKQGLQTGEIQANGPYQMERQENNEIVFEKSSSYWDSKNVTLEKIVVNIDSRTSALNQYEAGVYDYIYLSDSYKDIYKDSTEFNIINRNGQAALKRNYVRNVKYNGFRNSKETVTHFNTLDLKWAYIQGKE